jgi:hypothetical protein
VVEQGKLTEPAMRLALYVIGALEEQVQRDLADPDLFRRAPPVQRPW